MLNTIEPLLAITEPIWLAAVIFFLISVLIGFISALFGVGGGFFLPLSFTV